MFKKLLVANRGEIAIRVMRACRELDIKSVAVYSDLDAEAPHARYADEGYNVGPAPAAASYLNVDAIIEAAKRAGAEAIHPGYGFLAENAGFAQAVMDAGFVWVGPSPDVIDGMGEKTAARRVATEAGVATVTGTKEAVTSADEVNDFISRHGLPIAIKASAGGGGKGFRVVHDAGEIDDALSGAAREAQAYFSSPDVYLERYLERPRHIEVQVLGTADGEIVSFPERDCSLQRRHQKLVEESPSPALDDGVREAIMDAAAKVSRHVGYRNAGTCEFLLDSDGKTFYFLEMNTRLQVEHPVTELVTGIDLVKAQLAVAADEDVGFTQGDIELRGHAIECRVNAENPAKNFMPAPGHIRAYREPGGPGVRIDSGAEGNYTIPQVYDPLIAKLITYGSEREETRRRMIRALDEYEIEGLHTTIPFHRLMMADKRFVTGDYHTGTVERELDLSPLEQEIEPKAKPGQPELVRRTFSLELDGKRFAVTARERLDEVAPRKKPRPPKKLGTAGAGAGGALVAPMQGTVVKVLVEPGQEVKSGETVLVLEAMKMENAIQAHVDGKIEAINVTAGQSVQTGATLVIIT